MHFINCEFAKKKDSVIILFSPFSHHAVKPRIKPSSGLFIEIPTFFIDPTHSFPEIQSLFKKKGNKNYSEQRKMKKRKSQYRWEINQNSHPPITLMNVDVTIDVNVARERPLETLNPGVNNAVGIMVIKTNGSINPCTPG